MPENLPVFELLCALPSLCILITGACTWYRGLAKQHRATVPGFTASIVYRTAAAVLRRGNGQHHMRDKYDLQRWIRADWHQLTPHS